MTPPVSTEQIDLCQLALLILVLPLIGFLIQVFVGTKIPPKERQGDWIPTAFIFAAFCCACYMVVLLLTGDGSEVASETNATGTAVTAQAHAQGAEEGGHGAAEHGDAEHGHAEEHGAAGPLGIRAQRWYPEVGQDWLSFGGETPTFRVHFGILVDNLTIVMLFVVTLVSFLVHLYSMGYMRGEVRYNRFFAFLGLFTFSMLGLCITNNLLLLFMFWELVGLCSYFLIGFYYEKKSAQNASIKAFMTTRIGDLGFFIAILIIAVQAGSLDFQDIFASVASGSWAPALLTFAGIALFAGPIGKSAQFPLHVWLPDAMEGPTPVSALIHAATMVAAGVYLVGRMFPFLAGAPYFAGGDFFQSDVLVVVAFVGAFTAFFAATIAFSQSDIKKVLAYSTISQLGYMVLGLGVGSVSAGLFHLTTHAFFKALLFLGSGSVIHAVHSNEMKDMGGLSKKLPITWATFAIGTLAIAGLPFLSGFYSKEAILGQAYGFAEYRSGEGNLGLIAWLPFVLGILTAGMTAFYMFRMFFLTFHGKPKNEQAYAHAHESPWTMTVPLIVLAVLSVVAGGVLPQYGHWFADRVSSAVLVPFSGTSAGLSAVTEAAHHGHYTVMGLSIAMFLIGVIGAAVFFSPMGPLLGKDVVRAGTPLGALNHCLKNLWFVDRFFTWLVLHLLHLGQVVCGAFDRYVIDGFVNLWATICSYCAAVVGHIDYWGVDGTVRGIGDLCLWSGRRLRRLQSGVLQEYVYASLFIFGGVLLVVLLWML